MSLESPAPRGRRLPLTVVTILVVAAVAAITWSSRGRPGAWGETAIDPARRVALLERKNRAIALLESSNLDEADHAFAQLARDLPSEALPQRNLAICRLLALEVKGDDSAGPAVQAAEAMLEREPDSAVAILLAGRVLLHGAIGRALPGGAHRARGLKLLEQAIKLKPDDPVYTYALARLSEGQSPADRDRAGSALAEAARQAPDNLFVLGKLFLSQAQAESVHTGATIEKLRSALFPARPQDAGPAQETYDQLGASVEAVQKKQWEEVRFGALACSNFAKSDTAFQSDGAQVDPSPLAFILTEFQGRDLATVRPPSAPVPVTFTVQAGLKPEGEVCASRVIDYDLDGTPDLVVLRPGALDLLSRRAGDRIWTSVARVPVATGLTGLIVADLDRDSNADRAPTSPGPGPDKGVCQNAYPDVILHGVGGLAIHANIGDKGSGRRTFGTRSPGPASWTQRQVTAAALIDIDADGDLDIIDGSDNGVGLWCNQGRFQFAPVTSSSTLPPPTVRFDSLVPVDLDRDSDLDVVATGSTPGSSGTLENLRHQRFRWRALPSAPSSAAAVSLTVGDLQGRGTWDVVVAGPGGVHIEPHWPGAVSEGSEPRSSTLVDRAPATAIRLFDGDNDGVGDLVTWTGRALTVRRGVDAGVFEADPRVVQLPAEIRDVQIADEDGDGDLDFLVATAQGLFPVENRGGNANHWLDVKLQGREDNRDRSNVDGIGSLIEVRKGATYQEQIVDGTTTHFGLGSAAGLTTVRIVWTSGSTQTLLDPRPDQSICEPMTLKGSCPYAYTWTGKRFEFLTDLLWAAPLGLRAPDGSVVPPRGWEYLKVPGDRLAAREGRHAIRITEELWEAAYFDRVELLAVDHPEDVEIYSNEKVGPATLAPFLIHTVKTPRIPVTARDLSGRDVLDLVRREDGHFASTWERRIRSGYTTDHGLELDLGRFPAPRCLTLFLTGWVFPSDSSMAVGFSQDPTLDGPKWPSIWAPDAAGHWRLVRPFMGFPGGKTKTIAVDLTGLFTAGDNRLRIQTSAEICWDHVFFTVDEAPVATRIQALPLELAQLTHRGFSRRVEGRFNGPESYDHGQEDPGPLWPAMQGCFTRLGDVLELLAATDDKLVVMGSGDELSLEFSSKAPLTPGWKRDFILHSVGWDKDADVNTLAGQSVEPLPFQAMRSYPPRPRDLPPPTAAYTNYLQKYQTRRVSPARFWSRLARRPE